MHLASAVRVSLMTLALFLPSIMICSASAPHCFVFLVLSLVRDLVDVLVTEASTREWIGRVSLFPRCMLTCIGMYACMCAYMHAFL